MDIVVGIIGGALALVILGFIVMAIFSTMAGLAPSGARLASYVPKWAVHDRFYSNSQSEVVERIREAVRKSPAMKVSDEANGALLIDCKPTVRILGGGFGLIVRLSTTQMANGTIVSCDSTKKVKFAVPLSPNNALREVERTIRKKAKAEGLIEVIDGTAPVSGTTSEPGFG